DVHKTLVGQVWLLAGLTRRPPGKPKKQRFFSRGEKLMKRIQRRTLCSRCKGFGHNKDTCKEQMRAKILTSRATCCL
ncbi:hypothetical protein IGI04_005598, partial [Brassica rapa subsp. trilocularis]